MLYYQYYEQGTTYLLEVDHDKKVFSVGSFKGKPQRSARFVTIDQTAYAEHIRKIDKTYRCIDDRL